MLNGTPTSKLLTMTQREFKRIGGCGICNGDRSHITNTLNMPEKEWSKLTIATLDDACFGRISRGHAHFIHTEIFQYGEAKFKGLIEEFK